MKKNKKNLFFLILGLSFIASILFFLKIIANQKTTPSPFFPSLSLTPTPFSAFTPTPTILEKMTPSPTFSPEGKGDNPQTILDSLKIKFPLIEYLPYETQNFLVDYIAPLHLEVKIKNKIDKNLIEKEVLDWISSLGIDPQTHKIDYRYVSSPTPVP
ncbi:MAG: hypothetical protein ACPLKP_02675 [Microgenomates group bacterium]